jgi:hypothetical protein
MNPQAPPFTAVHDTPNKSIRQPVARRGVVLHHAAMTSLAGLRRLEMGAKQVSSTAIVKDDQIEQMLDATHYRAWSVSDAWGDSSFRSVETCNEAVAGWTISDASHESLAKVVAYWAQLDGFWPHRDGHPQSWTVIGHNEMASIWHRGYTTFCPGNINLNLVVARAQELLTSAPTPPAPEIPKEFGMAQRMYFARVDADGNDTNEWMLAGTDIGPHETDPKQDGYRVTTDKETARIWARQYSFRPTDTASVRLVRDDYVKQQEFARADAQAWRANLRSLLKD